MRRIVAAAVGVACVVLTVAGCADAQPGDQNNGPGYTDNAADLLVKVQALQADPCRGTQAAKIYSTCGRYVTEVANSVITLRDTVPSEATAITALSNSTTNFHQLGCDTVTGTPTPHQDSECPKSLVAIGTELDTIEPALAKAPSSGNP